MSSGRIFLVILGIVICILIVLSGNRIGAFMQSRFGKYLPSNKTVRTYTSPTPDITAIMTPPDANLYNSGDRQDNYPSENAPEIPATGPSLTIPLLLFTAGGLGIYIRQKKWNS